MLALLAVLSALGFAFPLCYALARAGVGVLCLALVFDALRLWLSTRLRAERYAKERFSNAEENAVAIRVENLSGHEVWLTVRDELPREFRYHEAVFKLGLRKGADKTITYHLRPMERGLYRFGHVLVYVRCHLGLLEWKLVLGKEQGIKVYPAYERLERYELMAANNNLLAPGQKRVRRPGHSTDFEQIRDYVRGDDFRTLNWKASARAGRWMVNTYRDERSQPIWCLIDKGRVMQRTFRNVTLLDYAINASLALSYVALRRYDMAGLVTFDSHINETVPASRIAGQLQLILEALYAQEVRYAETDFSALSVHLARHVHRRSLLVLFTDFTSRDSLHRQLPYLRRLACKHCLLVVFFEDEEVKGLAADSGRTLFDQTLNTLAADLVLEKNSLVSELRQYGICALLTTPNKLTADVVNKYVELKRRQAI